MKKISILLVLFSASILWGNIDRYNEIAFSIFDSVKKCGASETPKNFVFSPLTTIKTLNDICEFTKDKTRQELESFTLDISKVINSEEFKYVNFKSETFLFYKDKFEVEQKFKDAYKLYPVKEFKSEFFPKDEILAQCGITKEIFDDAKTNTVFSYVMASKFKGDWVNEPFKIFKREVFNTPKRKVDATFIQGDRISSFYIKNEKFEMAGLWFDGLTEIVFIKAKDLKTLNEFSLEDYKQTLKNSDNEKLRFIIPKFAFETKNNYISILKNLGVKNLFNDTLDYTLFKNFSDFIRVDLLQSNDFIKLDENGVEARTIVGIEGGILCASPRYEPTEFKLNKPFIFIIRYSLSKHILFMGKIEDPTEN